MPPSFPRPLLFLALGLAVLCPPSRADGVLPGLATDAEARREGAGDGSGTVANPASGSLHLGNPNNSSSSSASPVYAFLLPDLGPVSSPFAEAVFSVGLVTSASTFNGFNLDVYGLSARDSAAVLGDDAFAGGADSTDATRLVDNWINFNTGTAVPAGLRTFSNAALAAYLNAQYAGGSGAGRHVFIRLSPDAVGSTFKNIRFASAENPDTALRPSLAYTLAGPPPPPPANRPPVLPAQAARAIVAGNTLTVVNTATDPDLPAQTLAYELLDSPAGAAISASGVITWTPSPAQASATPYVIETRVTDNGDPALSSTNSFQVTVAEPPPPGSYFLNLDLATAGQFFQNFRITKPRDGGTSGQSGNVFSLDGVADFTSSEIYTLDLTPADTRTATQSAFALDFPLVVAFDARVTTAASSVGVEFTDPHNFERNLLAYFTINTGADSFRFYKNTDGGYVGDQVGSTVSAATDAESAGAFVRVTVTLAIENGIPSLTLAVPGAAPVVRTFAAADLDWSHTLVSLRLVDAGQAAGTPVQITNLAINAGAAPVAPLPPPPPAPPVIPVGAPVPAGVNLLLDNPSFEAAAVSFGNGDYAFAGWTGRNQRFSTNATTNAGSPGGGNRAFRITWGGNLATAPASRPVVTPFHTYALTWSVRTTRVNWPELRPGSLARLDFFDADGVLLKTYWGPDWRPQIPSAAVTPWETYTVRGVAPEGAVRAGVRFNADQGQFIGGVGSREDNREVEVDDFRLVRLEEPLDRLALRRAPRLLAPGATAEVRVHHAAPVPRQLHVALVGPSGQTLATGGYPVPAGRRLNTVRLALPAALPDGDYAWHVELRPLDGGPVVAVVTRADAFADSVVSPSAVGNGRDFTAAHPKLVFMGRIEDADPARRWLHWMGSEVRVRFSGTSLSLLGSAGPNGFGGATPAEIVVVINEDHQAATRITLSSFNAHDSVAFPLVSGLPDGVHTARIFKAGESNQRVRVDGFRVDSGRGLLRAEPLPGRRLEIFGDSVTSGGNARLTYFGYAFRLGRELDADIHVISKGGTGVASSFSGQDLLGNYWDNLAFPNTFNASSADSLPWDFSRWTPHGAIIAIGHNDQFNNGAATFPAEYAEFHGLLRSAYGPALPILSTNTIISGAVAHFEGAVSPLLPLDPKLRWAHQLSASAPVGGHPSTQGHAAMIAGDTNRFSLAEVVEQSLGWGLDAPLSGYEQWVLGNYTPEEIALGAHAPAADLASGDGVPALLRYALGATPDTPARDVLPALSTDAQGRLRLTFPRAADDLRYVVETSADLVAWTPAATFDGADETPTTWTDESPVSEKSRRFARLRVLTR